MHDGAIPSGLAAMPPGPELCAALAPVPVGAVPDVDLLEVLNAEWRQLACQQARVWAVLAELGSRDPMVPVRGAVPWTREEIVRSAVDEIRAELLLTRRSAETELDHAMSVAALPRVADALRAGRLDRRRAIVLAEGCTDLTGAQAETLLDEVLPTAGQRTATALSDRVRRVAVALDPGWAERRYRDAVRERRVIGYLAEDGSATITGQGLEADQAAAACARVDAVADAAKRAGASARLDQLRADVFLGLLSGRFQELDRDAIIGELVRRYPGSDNSAPNCDSAAPSTARPVSVNALPGVHVRVGLATLLGLDDHPGEVAGWGTITAEVARTMTARQHRGQWRYAIHDEPGRSLFDGTTRHRPRSSTTDPHLQAEGGIVELHVPVHLLTDHTAQRHPDWARLIADLATQHAAKTRPAQDPDARFPARPLRRHTQTRHQHCVFPGCRRPATDCDLDHRHDHARGGKTQSALLEPLCRADHGSKTSRGWRLLKLDPHTFRWVSALGRRHDVQIPPIAPSLPDPIPRSHLTEPADDDDADWSSPRTFTPHDQRGRPVPNPAAKTEPDDDGEQARPPPEPPPF